MRSVETAKGFDQRDDLLGARGKRGDAPLGYFCLMLSSNCYFCDLVFGALRLFELLSNSGNITNALASNRIYLLCYTPLYQFAGGVNYYTCAG